MLRRRSCSLALAVVKLNARFSEPRPISGAGRSRHAWTHAEAKARTSTPAPAKMIAFDGKIARDRADDCHVRSGGRFRLRRRRSERRRRGGRVAEASVSGSVAGGDRARGVFGPAASTVVVGWEILAAGRTMLSVEPAIEMSDVNELGEPLVDVYGTPWGQVLSGMDPEALIVSGTATVRIPAGIPDVE